MSATLQEASDGTSRASSNRRDGTHKNHTPPTRRGYLYIGIGIIFLLGLILSLISYFLPTHQDDGNRHNDGGTYDHLVYEYWNETRPFLRILTVLPVTIVICICHWVSLRIYLRR